MKDKPQQYYIDPKKTIKQMKEATAKYELLNGSNAPSAHDEADKAIEEMELQQ